jgi:hypothetical protein
VLALVRLVRRRLFNNELLAQGANASSAALLAFILLLLLGTEILAWQVALVLPLAAAAIGFYIARRRRPSPYDAARIIDRRLGLSDTLSTALHFSESAHSARVAPGVVAAQAAAAESVARGVDVRQAAPYRMPRTAYAMAALFLVAGSLFALRYGISRRLDLKQPLASMLHQTFGYDPVEQARNKMPKVPKPDLSPDGELASAEERLDRAGDAMEGVNEIGEQATEGQPGKSESKNADGKKSQESGEQSEGDQNDSASDAESGSDDNPGSGQQSDKQDGKEGNSKQDSGNSNDNSLLSKMKDAVQNLLSRMKPQQNQAGQQQSGEQQGQKQGKGQQGAKQQSAKNGQQQGGEQQSEGQDGQSGEPAQNAQDQQGKGTGNSDSKQASKQPGSGVGSQDGDKKLKNAEQLAAMGKISEIIGKRSQTISGETTVEVQNTHQQLRTQYANRSVQHTQAGAEIGRDEIPVALQSYVEQYFEAVRKSAAPPAAPAKK